MQEPLTPEQEAEAQQLTQLLAKLAQEDLLQMARAIVSAPKGQLFGATEFKVRDLALQLAARVYQQHLGQKKTATKDPA
jgi:F420-0:gamma-glutamyl ligase